MSKTEATLPPAGMAVAASAAGFEEELLPAPPEEELLEGPLSTPELPAAPVARQPLPAARPVEERSVSREAAAREPVRTGKVKMREESIFYLETQKIKANEQQPRRYFDEDAIKDLANSIREFGILQPIVVTKKEREVPGGTEVEYELIAGERRLLAAKSLGMERIPAIIRHVDLERERLELAIIENLQREDLNGIEMARAFARLQDEFRLTQREIAARLGKSRETVANTMRLLDLPSYIQEAIEKGEVSESHGLLLLGVDDAAEQQALFRDLIAKKLTIRELRDRAKVMRRKRPGSEPGPELKSFEEQLAAGLGAPVKIERKGDGGRISISFYSDEEFQNILRRLGGEE